MCITADKEMSFQMGSSFHGALMEQISTDYADFLHVSRLHPYTQHLERHDDGWHWIVTTLNKDAKERIIDETLMPLTDIELRKHQIKIHIASRDIQELSEMNLLSTLYEDKSDRYITIKFVTPTSFKSDGRYQNIPDIRSIYSSLMNKYDAASDTESMRDTETLDELTKCTTMSRYILRSTVFSVEGARIPSFLGEITFRIYGPQTMCNLANMLVNFGEYSGIGIKTALGMGAICSVGRMDRG